jgi:hypothetical protein
MQQKQKLAKSITPPQNASSCHDAHDAFADQYGHGCGYLASYAKSLGFSSCYSSECSALFRRHTGGGVVLGQLGCDSEIP